MWPPQLIIFLFLDPGKQVWLLFHCFFFYTFFFNSPPHTRPDPPPRRQFRSDPPVLRPRAVEPFHTRKCKEKRRGGGGREGSEGPFMAGQRKAVGRRSRLSFQYEKAERKPNRTRVFKRSDCRKKPEPSLVEHVVFVCEEEKKICQENFY